MPAAGEQYRGIANPFEDAKPRISEWTAQEIATLQSRLDKQLGPEFISSRKGPNNRTLYYLPAEKAINLANEVFGFNGWSSSIQNVQIDFVDQSQSTGKVSLGLSVIIRVTLRDGTFHEDIGYGHIENCTGKAAAFEKAKKEAATDALKRALRTFGNVLGNCLYDKNYESKISKMKVAPSKWNPDNLHRHREYASESAVKTDKIEPQTEEQKPVRVTSDQTMMSNGTDVEDEFGGNLFDGVNFDRSDENEDSAYQTMLIETPGAKPDEPPGPAQQRQAINRVQSLPSLRPTNGVQQPQHQPPMNARPPQAPNGSIAPQPEPPRHRVQPPNADTQQTSRPQQQQPTMPHAQAARTAAHQERRTPPSTDNSAQDTTKQPQQQPPQGAPVQFVTGRAAALLQKAEALFGLPQDAPAFNPHAESPSLRRTSGVNHRTSAPVSRLSITANQGGNSSAANGNGAAAPGAKPNFVTPQADMNRRIGMPSAAQSPLANRSTYKPPGPLKRPAEAPPARPPLADMSNVQVDGVVDGAESKKPRLRES